MLVQPLFLIANIERIKFGKILIALTTRCKIISLEIHIGTCSAEMLKNSIRTIGPLSNDTHSVGDRSLCRFPRIYRILVRPYLTPMFFIYLTLFRRTSVFIWFYLVVCRNEILFMPLRSRSEGIGLDE